jgi:hypothetical protein
MTGDFEMFGDISKRYIWLTHIDNNVYLSIKSKTQFKEEAKQQLAKQQDPGTDDSAFFSNQRSLV